MANAPVLSDVPANANLSGQILNSFQGKVPPVPVPLIYRLGLAVVTLVMVLLPLIYIGLICLLGYGVWQHAAAGPGVWDSGRSRGSAKGALFMYLAPLVVGSILILFMIKPLFARKGKSQKPRVVGRKDEPLLYLFVERICQMVGAPAPKEIHINCDVNASASFREGFLSMLGSDLVLTIGLPLAGGLSLQQFAGVLAHEFGHFAQHAGMRLTYVIRSINFWFARVVYERDEWDEWLVATSQEVDLRIGIVLYLARFFVWITRKILWVLMIVGHAASCFMLRQMEYDADRYEALVAGSESFEQTVMRLKMLSVANQGAHQDLKSCWDEGQLADDFPALIFANQKYLSEDVNEKIREHIKGTRTGLFDTHPADTDRIANAHTINSEGLFNSDLPGPAVFKDFAGLSKAATSAYYKELLGPRFRPDLLIPVSKVIDKQDKEQEGSKALQRLFQEQICYLRPLPLPQIFVAAPENPQSSIDALTAARASLASAAPRYRAAREAYSEADQMLLASKVLGGGFKLKAETFDLPKIDPQQTGSVRKKALVDQESHSADMAPFEETMGARVVAALSLLHVPEFAGKMENAAEMRAEAERLLPVIAHIGGMIPDLSALRHSFQAQVALFSSLEGNEQNETLISSIKARSGEVHRKVKAIYDKLGDVKYPFEHANGTVSLRKYTIGSVPNPVDYGQIASAADDLGSKLFSLYFRMLGHLALTVEKVEIAAGLPPPPDVKKPTEPTQKTEAHASS